jgi:hypothetical protein
MLPLHPATRREFFNHVVQLSHADGRQFSRMKLRFQSNLARDKIIIVLEEILMLAAYKPAIKILVYGPTMSFTLIVCKDKRQ